MKRYIAKHRLGELKYVAVTQRGKKKGRHHHVAIRVEKGIDWDELEKLWTKTKGHGYANTRRLQFTENGIAGLGHYIMNSHVGKKAWTASKNLVIPEPRTRDGRISGRKARELAEKIQDNTEFERLYPGWLMSNAEAFHNDVNGGCYLVAQFYKENGTFIRPEVRQRN